MARIEHLQVGEELRVAVLVPDSILDAVQSGPVDVGVGDIADQLSKALDFVAAYAQEASRRLGPALKAASPDEVSLELGIAVGSEAGVLLASAKVEGQIKVTMTWKGQA